MESTQVLELTWAWDSVAEEVYAEVDGQRYVRRRCEWDAMPRIGSTWEVRPILQQGGRECQVIGIREIAPGDNSDFGDDGLPLPQTLVFEKGHNGVISFFQGRVCIPCERAWTGHPFPIEGDVWDVTFSNENPRQTVYFVSPLDFKGRDESVILPERQVVTFLQGRDAPVATIDGKTSLPCSSQWGERAPELNEQWEVEVVGRNPKRTMYFLRAVRFVGVFDPLAALRSVPNRLIVYIDDNWNGQDGPCAFLRSKPAFAASLPSEGPHPLAGESWAVEVISESDDSYQISLFCRVAGRPLEEQEAPQPGSRHQVTFKKGRLGDAIAFIDPASGKPGFPAKEHWGEPLPVVGDVWVVDVILDIGKAFLLVPVCLVKKKFVK
jgi:hypothetical protein